MKLSSNSTFCAVGDSLSGMQSFNSWNNKLVAKLLLLFSFIFPQILSLIATDEGDISVMLQQWPFY